ncbi:hypothetical protein RSJ21_06550 [Clostridium botulinum]|uniref:Rubrerythrin diiron-binding domain-containing protein n=1 Tax=Clostridium botulinum (strain Kyoto / Type A2) TaxID=536232 RepID=C1FK86_CLOBJ|nr:hypothetical protein [Clostridium botulinum]ACO85880.1 conserved hypothetical protein [Clostridium botulinum A2 str. Kyoto]APH22992.1 hypothetical protein NPD1_2514 [Clostridium botulinum]APQ67993.1 hypothetical protein RSJ8_640 [Clostridium botulinum]AUN06311.1 hypothetical protein RSJ14_06210 [Clostridium botulinum]AUN10090.1 hypothetical protein RSJ6_06105 [Clostridium botulinum]
MAYTIIDIINNLIDIEKKGFSMFREISNNCKNLRVSIVSKTISNQEKKHIQYYENLKKDIDALDKEDIDFSIYDKISSRMQQFKVSITIPIVTDTKKLINFARELSKENLALLIYIQGQLIRKEIDTNMLAYNVMGKIIEEQEKYSKSLRLFYK